MDLAESLDDEFEIERIISKRTRNNQTQYLVKWVGYTEADATWLSMDELSNAPEAVTEYENSIGAGDADSGIDDMQMDPDESSSSASSGSSSSEAASGSSESGSSGSASVSGGSASGSSGSDSSGSGSSGSASASGGSASGDHGSASASGSGAGSGGAGSEAVHHQIAPLPTRTSQRARGFGPDGSPVVHMAMTAVQGMHTEDIRHESVVYAVSAGVGLLEDQTPGTYQQAVTGPDADRWRASMDLEMGSCAALDVWEHVPRADLPKGTNILPVKWVYKIKTDEEGNVTTYKSRLTPKGFKQRYGQDYFEVYAATGMYKTMRLGLSLAAFWDHELEQLDVPTAFLNADVNEDVYMEVPDGYRAGREHLVCKLKKALYGLKQAPRMWYLLISRFITETLGYRASVSDPCLFYKRSRTGRLMILFLFVDDFQSNFHREDAAEWGEAKACLISRFKTKDMGASTWILGMRIRRDRAKRTITLDQELYVTKALEKYGLRSCKVAATPEVTGPVVVPGSTGDAALDQPADHVQYMELVGTLMYAGISTRPDIAHAAHALASRMQQPTVRDMVAAERVLRYLSGTPDLGLVFGSRNGQLIGYSRGRAQLQLDVCAYADADWANGKGDRRSITGWVAKINGDTISWASKKQRTVALSTCEAELYAEAAAIQEVLWLRGLLKELGLHAQHGSVVHGDNQSAIAVSKNGIKGERTKHVDIKYHFVTETVERGDVQLKWVPTTEMQADIFTKALAAPVFEHFRRQLMTR